MTRMTFDTESVADEQRDVIPPGVYVGQIIESDLAPTKAGTGQVLTLTWEIMDGACAHRRIWDRVNILNQNPQAQEIGQRQLKRICTAVGLAGTLTDSEQLHFRPCRVRVAIEEDRSGQYAPKNVVKGAEPLNGSVAPGPRPISPATTAPAPVHQAPVQAAAAGGTRPWR